MKGKEDRSRPLGRERKGMGKASRQTVDELRSCLGYKVGGLA